MKIAFRMATPTLLPKEAEDSKQEDSLLEQLGLGGEAEETKSQEPEAKEEEEAEAKPQQKKKKERQIAIPKDSATFFRARAKNVKMFQFTADGNLQVPELRGEVAKVIDIPYYRHVNDEEIALDEQERFEKLQGVEREFDETFKLLRAAILEWRQTGFSSDVIKYQRDLQRLDAQRTQLRSPLRWTKTYKNLEVSRILLSEVYEKRKIGYPVAALKTRTMTFETMFRASSSPPAPSSEVVQEELEEEAEGEPEDFIVFLKPDDVAHGFLSPYTMVEFIYNSTKYNCVLQAYEGERLNLLNRKDIRPVLLKSRNPSQMRLIAAKVTGQLENPRELLVNILKALTSQHPNLADSLRETGTSTLVFAEIKDGVLGVGMLPNDPLITEKAEWKGKNFLGQAWTVIRNDLPPLPAEEEQESVVQQGGYTEHGTTKEEVTAVRANVLKGYYRHKARQGFV
jgi:predicted NAD-dependent protein-ADP-ribosyltransferase YbiA (DUF1768 family)